MIKYMWKIACTGLLFFGLLFSSCKNENFEIGGYLTDPRTSVVMIDTLTVVVSNLVSADSVVTSGRSVGFAGSYYDPEIGRVQAESFVEFSRSSESESDKYAIFDSVMLVLRSDANYYGDTVVHSALKISKLAKPIYLQDDGYMYSTSSVPVGDLLVDTTFRLRVKNKQEAEIKLPKSFGQWLFKGIVFNDDAFNSDNYLRTFPGLSIASGTGSNCVNGYMLQDSACMIRIYYHITTTEKTDKKMEFKANASKSFYSMNNDKSQLPKYNSKSDPVPSSQTGHKGIIMSGTPMYARLEFPYLNNLLALFEIVNIKDAWLYVSPIRRTYDTIPLPPELNIYYFDPTSNTPLSSAIRPPGSSTNTGAQNGSLPADYQYLQSPDFPQYKFNVTDFISSQLGKSGYNKWAISLLIPEGNQNGSPLNNSLQRLVFGDQKYEYIGNAPSADNQIELQVTYVVYNSFSY